jgi:cellobiose-specific phosphotransferase system component IIC
MIKISKLIIASCAFIATTAEAQTTDVTGHLAAIFDQYGLGEFTLQKYLLAALLSFASFFLIPYLVARFNGVDRQGAKHLGLQGLLGAFLIAGVFTVPFGLIAIGRALYIASFPHAEPRNGVVNK